MPDGGHGAEIALLESFAQARGLKPGDTLAATLNGTRRAFRISGLVRSPEFLFTTPPGEIVPDDARFAVIWMPRPAMEALFDMRGAFNEALVTLMPGTAPQAVIARLDPMLDTYGGTGAYDLEEHVSNKYISEEIRGLRSTSASIPPIFLGIAAFLLNIVVRRMVQAERGQIGLLKAFGYSSIEVSLHYLKLVLVIAVAGASVGAVAGIAAGNGMAVLYQTYFKFPFIVFQVDPRAFVISFAAAIASASLGGLLVLRGVFSLTPAVAMRPPTPPDYSRTADLARLLKRWLDQPSRMVLRRLTRHPGRMGGAILLSPGGGLRPGSWSWLGGHGSWRRRGLRRALPRGAGGHFGRLMAEPPQADGGYASDGGDRNPTEQQTARAAPGRAGRCGRRRSRRGRRLRHRHVRYPRQTGKQSEQYRQAADRKTAHEKAPLAMDADALNLPESCAVPR